MKPDTGMLEGRTIAIPESRQLDVLATLVEARGGEVLRVPLIDIRDAPDPAPVLHWMKAFIAGPCDRFIILTGEGVRRLLTFADRAALREDFTAALGRVCKICRGPKPDRALAEIGLKGDIAALSPTTEGVIQTLDAIDIEGETIAVQLYGEDPNTRLIDYLESRQVTVMTVAPYVYADQTEDARVVDLIHRLCDGQVDAIAFTSQPQFRRLQTVARKEGLEAALDEGLRKVLLAAVGPVVRDQLQTAGYTVPIMPERTWFMKPLVSAMGKYFSARS